MALTAENIQKDEEIAITEEIASRISERLNEHQIKGVLLNPLPKGYSDIKNTNKKASLLPGPNRLVIEFETEYFSQIAGRFRWVVHAKILFQESEYIRVENLSIPVFHKFGHLQDAASIESALPRILDEVSEMINERLSGIQQ